MHKKIIAILLGMSCGVQAGDLERQLVHAATYSKNEQRCAELIARGADPAAADAENPGELVRRIKWLRIAHMILERGGVCVPSDILCVLPIGSDYRLPFLYYPYLEQRNDFAWRATCLQEQLKGYSDRRDDEVRADTMGLLITAHEMEKECAALKNLLNHSFSALVQSLIWLGAHVGPEEQMLLDESLKDYPLFEVAVKTAFEDVNQAHEKRTKMIDRGCQFKIPPPLLAIVDGYAGHAIPDTVVGVWIEEVAREKGEVDKVLADARRQEAERRERDLKLDQLYGQADEQPRREEGKRVRFAADRKERPLGVAEAAAAQPAPATHVLQVDQAEDTECSECSLRCAIM